MTEYNGWNPVLRKVTEIKHTYLEHFGEIDYDRTSEGTCLERWVHRLSQIDTEYEQMLNPLKFSQKGMLLLIHYGDYNRLFDGTGLDYTSFWDLYDGFYQECRGVVIDVETETLVLTPFRKFWNLNEREETMTPAVQERIRRARCVEFSEKLDGSMQCARWFHDGILMSGSMSIDPDN